MRRIIVYFSIVVFLLSCGSKNDTTKSKILSNDKMQEVLWDMFQADAFTDKFIKIDSSQNTVVQNVALQQKIFQLHKISKEDFYSSYSYYSSHPDVMRILLDSIIAKAERKKNKVIEEQYSGKKVVE